jgi:SEC-C motif-containing protein
VTRACPCGLPADYTDCCGRFHSGAALAPTAERLMRSRFSAFAVADPAYLLRTWHPSTRPRTLDLDPTVRWTRLEVLETEAGTALHRSGTVRFRAHSRHRGHAEVLEEQSRFVTEHGAWLYVAAAAGRPTLS